MKFSLSCLFAFGFLVVAPQAGFATSFSDAITPTAGVVFPPTTSWDPGGPMFPNLSSLFDTNTVYGIGAFSGEPGGSTLSFTMFQERGSLADQNELRLLRASGGYDVVFAGSAQPGDTATVSLSGSETYVFALNNYLGNFSAVPQYSSDSQRHFYALRAQNSGWLTINAPLMSGGTPFSTYITAGEYFVYVEDLPFYMSDFDYNDLTFGIVSSEVPEPSTILLLSSALLGFAGRKRLRRKA